IYDVLPMTSPSQGEQEPVVVALLKVSYQDHEAENYLLPIAFADEEMAVKLAVESPQAAFARLTIHRGNQEVLGLLFDASYDKRFGQMIAQGLLNNSTLPGRVAQSMFTRGTGLLELDLEDATPT